MDRPRGSLLRPAAVSVGARSDRRGAHPARRPRAGLRADPDLRWRRPADRGAPGRSSIYDLPPGPEHKPAVTVPTVLGRPVALLMNLPQLAEDIPAGRPYAAVFARPWYGEAAIWRSATEEASSPMRWAGRRGSGRLAFDLYGGPAGRFDLGNEAWIDLPSAALASVTDQALFAGENALAVEFARRGLGSPSVRLGRADEPKPWRLRRLLRGQLGTEDAIGNPAPAGARVVMLDAAVTALSNADADIGLPGTGGSGRPARPAIRSISRSSSHRRGAGCGPTARRIFAARRSPAARSCCRGYAALGRPPATAGCWPRRRSARSARNTSSKSSTARHCGSHRRCAAVLELHLHHRDDDRRFGGLVSTVRFRVFQIGVLGRGAPAEAWS